MIQINGVEWNELTTKNIEDAITEIEESFFFEFKEDDVSNKKIVEEISAFANTYGGYIFIGVSDDKEIKGCEKWDEQRIFAVIHDSISPTPSFDVKKFAVSNKKDILVIRVDEGGEPPYITNKGLIYERISSSSCAIKDSGKLTQLYVKRIDQIKAVEQKLTINKIETSRVGNIYAYIDLGFAPTLRNVEIFKETFNNVDLESVLNYVFNDKSSASISRIGNSIMLTFGSLHTKTSDGKKIAMPAHLNNFIEIMNDGSVRIRLLLYNNDKEELTVNMFDTHIYLRAFENTYRFIFGKLLEDNFVYAKKYEKITVMKQFYPLYYYSDAYINGEAKLQEINRKYKDIIEDNINKKGKDTVITDDRIPKTGLVNIDQRILEKNGLDFTEDDILFILFNSRFSYLGYVREQEDIL